MASGQCGVNIFWGSWLEGRKNFTWLNVTVLRLATKRFGPPIREAFLAYCEHGLGTPLQCCSIKLVRQRIEETQKEGVKERDEEDECGYSYGVSSPPT